MPDKIPTLQHPSGDKRYKLLDATIKRHQFQPNALLEVLHTAQELFGFLEEELLIYVARALRVPTSRAYGVATFYNFFSLRPQGKHTCVICMGTACYVKGAAEILSTLEKSHQIKAGETTADGLLSITTARCVGACGIAPAVVFDGTVEGQVTPQFALERTQQWRAETV